MFNVIHGIHYTVVTDESSPEKHKVAKASEIVQAFVSGMEAKDLRQVVAMIKACQNDGSWQEVRKLVNATLGLIYVESNKQTTILSEHTGGAIWCGPSFS